MKNIFLMYISVSVLLLHFTRTKRICPVCCALCMTGVWRESQSGLICACSSKSTYTVSTSGGGEFYVLPSHRWTEHTCSLQWFYFLNILGQLWFTYAWCLCLGKWPQAWWHTSAHQPCLFSPDKHPTGYQATNIWSPGLRGGGRVIQVDLLKCQSCKAKP